MLQLPMRSIIRVSQAVAATGVKAVLSGVAETSCSRYPSFVAFRRNARDEVARAVLPMTALRRLRCPLARAQWQIFAGAPTRSAYRAVRGFSCPESGVIDGSRSTVRLAARRLKRSRTRKADVFQCRI